MNYEYAHQDDTFKTSLSSGLDAVPVIGIDEAASEARHLRYIQEGVALGQGGIPAVKYLWEQWAGAETLDTLGLG